MEEDTVRLKPPFWRAEPLLDFDLPSGLDVSDRSLARTDRKLTPEARAETTPPCRTKHQCCSRHGSNEEGSLYAGEQGCAPANFRNQFFKLKLRQKVRFSRTVRGVVLRCVHASNEAIAKPEAGARPNKSSKCPGDLGMLKFSCVSGKTVAK